MLLEIQNGGEREKKRNRDINLPLNGTGPTLGLVFGSESYIKIMSDFVRNVI